MEGAQGIEAAMRKPDWFCVSIGIFENPKILMAVERAGPEVHLLYLRGLAYIVHNLTDGWVPEVMPKAWGYKPRHTQALEAACLWYPTPIPGLDEPPPGWFVHDWEQYQVSRAEWEAKSEKARIAAKARWASKQIGGMTIDDPRHGTINGYTNLGCRCPECRAAGTQSRRRLRGV